MVESPYTFRWERTDALSEQARFSLRTGRDERRGILLCFVTDDPTTWVWSTLQVSVDDSCGEVARGTASRQDYARRLAEQAAALRLDELRGIGVRGVPWRGPSQPWREPS